MHQFKFFISLLIPALVSFHARADRFNFKDLFSTPVQNFDCLAELHGPRRAKVVKLQDENQVIVTSWNPENVMEHKGKFEPDGIDPKTGKYSFQPEPEPGRELDAWKFPAKQKKITDVGRLLGIRNAPLSHFVITPEVESLSAAEELFNGGALKDKYRVHLLEGNDSRGINIAFAVRADLDVDVEMETHKKVKWFDPVEGREARLFSRDIPAMIVRDRESKTPLLVLLGTHYKSMRDRANGRDPKSKILREAQIEATAKIVEQYKKRFGEDFPILLAGDFNTDVQSTDEVAPLKNVLRDSFDLFAVKDRTTHTYHPSDEPTVKTQLDSIMISPSMAPYLIRAAVLPEFHFNTGMRLDTPKSLRDRLENFPSDHRAIAIVLSGVLFRSRPHD